MFDFFELYAQQNLSSVSFNYNDWYIQRDGGSFNQLIRTNNIIVNLSGIQTNVVNLPGINTITIQLE
jgi:hypothetical protein